MNDQATAWRRLLVPGWYGEGDRVIEICTQTAVWYHTGLPPVPIHWVLIRDPLQRFEPPSPVVYGSDPKPADHRELVRAALAS